jgi:hypothetical protein
MRVIFAALALSLLPLAAHADEPGPRIQIISRNGQRTYVVKDAIVVEGERPNAFVLLERARLRYDDPLLSPPPLLEKIVAAASHHPF